MAIVGICGGQGSPTFVGRVGQSIFDSFRWCYNVQELVSITNHFTLQKGASYEENRFPHLIILQSSANVSVRVRVSDQVQWAGEGV